MSGNDDARANPSLNKRQRLLNIMRTTRDVYVPTFTTTMSQLKSDASSTIKSYYDASGAPGTSSGAPLWPADMKTLVYPSYTRLEDGGRFETHIRGLVFTPGTMNRKSRLILSLCRQLIRPSSPTEKTAIDEQSETRSTDSQSTFDSASNHSSLALDSSEENTLRSRIAGFLQKHIMGVNLAINISDGYAQEECTYVATDSWGNYNVKVVTQFKPENIDVKIDVPDGMLVNCPINIVENSGFALISDVDDTIKHTGVTGDKRSLFTNVFVHELKTWSIPGMPIWYNTLKDAEKVDFFYVSNSPFQIYPLLDDYISQNFPPGPLFLKQYSGNLMSSLMSSSAKRKLGSILSILKDFPQKRFILVGDSGERDLEAYTEAVKQFPTQIAAIYIRCCKQSMSDVVINDLKVVQELNYMIETKYYKEIKSDSVGLHPNLVRRQESSDHNNIPDLIQFDENSKGAPIKPQKKPTLSKSQQVDIDRSRRNAPSLPPRKHATFPVRDKDSLTFNRSATDDIIYCTPSSQNDYGTYSTFFDSRADSWRQRVMHTILELKSSGANVRLQFFTQPELCLEDSIEIIRREKEKSLQQKPFIGNS
ncbi:LANO_0H08680g1_1 [Lachancea nothofagi CBS 11611]|uniref:LANO_0H08680g1_1 n=1 Tax=Lachancea nothofagi CBS 11611 TaxID=1266666 RepID=A0A1G4KLN7_9SACH|nr:LANO_0H08680g1_1 [Lachancea nothofagi CBS 11611]